MKVAGIELSLVVIDTLSAAANFKSASDTAEVQRAMNVMTALSATVRLCPVLLVDHYGKDPEKGVRDSSAKVKAAADVVLVIDGKKAIDGTLGELVLVVAQDARWRRQPRLA